VFDERVALGHGLKEAPRAPATSEQAGHE